jgi:hypothetical protein
MMYKKIKMNEEFDNFLQQLNKLKTRIKINRDISKIYLRAVTP